MDMEANRLPFLAFRKGNDKGNVEGVVGYARRNFMTPLPRFASWDAFNGHLEEQCRNRQGNVLRGHRESIGERFVRDREALKRPLPAPFDACDKQGTRVNSLSLVRYRTNDYSVPVAYGHQEVWIRGYVHEVVIGCGAGIIARHPRSHDREDMVFDPIHYLPLLEHKIGTLDQAAPLAGWELPDAFPTPDRGFAGPPHPPCPYPGNERRELSSQPKPKTAEIPKNTCLTAGAMVDPVGPQEPPTLLRSA